MFRLQRWRVVILAILFALPFVFLMGFGTYQLWMQGWSFWYWWAMAACLALAYFLAWRWQAARTLLTHDTAPPLHWTERDREAWKVVEAFAQARNQQVLQRLGDIQLYLETADDLAHQLAQVFYPGAKDPFGSLTLPEILAVVELASHDLSEMTREYLPGGHLITINDLRRARQATDIYQQATNVWWAVSAVLSPFSTGTRFLASRMGISAPWQMLQQNLILWIFTVYMHRLGHYLIELYSGRLRVGASRYRELKERSEGDIVSTVVTLTLFGQVKAGKSSLVNALLGEQKARADVLPATDAITGYDLQAPGVPSHLVVQDTVGYGHEGPREDQVLATEKAARTSDVLLLVMHAKNPARQADLDMLKRLRAWFAKQPGLKMPPVLGVLTHVDLLSPALEWKPPYDWKNPTRTKEKQMAEALAAAREPFGDMIAGIVPVCTAPERLFGIQEALLPTLSAILPEAKAVNLVRCLQVEADEDKVKRVFQQLFAVGRELYRAAVR